MSEVAIGVESLGKRYRIGRTQQRHDTLRDALVDVLPRIARISTKKTKFEKFVLIRGKKKMMTPCGP